MLVVGWRKIEVWAETILRRYGQMGGKWAAKTVEMAGNGSDSGGLYMRRGGLLCLMPTMAHLSEEVEGDICDFRGDDLRFFL
jgi:hypothetical protein